VSSVALMLDHLGLAEPAQRINDAVTADLAQRGTSRRRTSEIGDALAARAAS
jgi:3-isopropylmalate dehydrogenase